ncbi:putative Hit-family protein [Streptomyces sp. Tu6071]|nr:putative Hit-family protein [Streptomyces sp. Tu6071]
MHVEDGLPRPRTGVEHDPVPGLVDLLLRGDLTGRREEGGAEPRIGGERGGVGVVRLGHDEHVRGRLRIDVPERDGVLVLPHDGRRHLPRHDLAEQTIRLRLTSHEGDSSRRDDDAAGMVSGSQIDAPAQNFRHRESSRRRSSAARTSNPSGA